MKVLTVSTYDIRPGAARSAHRMHKVLSEFGIDALMLVQNKSSDDYSVIGYKSQLKKVVGLARPKIDQIPVRLYRKTSKTLFSPAWTPFNSIVKRINNLNPDIVHFHWVSGGMIPFSKFHKIKAPIVWTLHDMWPFTGGCHYTEGCENYTLKCGNCKVLNSQHKKDLSTYSYRIKKKAYSKKNDLVFIGLSKWITESARKSLLLNDKAIVNIPNFIDTDFFKPIDKSIAREAFKLPKSKNLILFGSINPNGDKRKGFRELMDAIKKINPNKDIELVVFGGTEPKGMPKLPFPVHYLGFLKDEVSVMLLYNACDIIISPSLQENLSDVIMAGQSCGTPVVCFNIGGNVDMVKHKQTGYLAKAYDKKDLADGIIWTMDNLMNLGKNAREYSIKNFSKEVVIPKYISLYKKIIKEKN